MNFEHHRERFANLFSQHSSEINSPDEFYWYNTNFEGEKIRWAHVQHYIGDPVEVLHILLVPYDSSPIFGLDVVSIAGNTTLACADFTPTVEQHQWDCPFENNREVPDWADFFSDDVLFTRPEGNADEICEYFYEELETYIENLSTSSEDESEIIKSQNEYMKKQRQNSKTFKTLAANIGEDRAERYMKNYLFPIM